MKKSELNDQDLVDAVKEMQAGLIDADLGGDIYIKSVLPLVIRVRVQGLEQLLQQKRMMFGFIYLALKKT